LYIKQVGEERHGWDNFSGVILWTGDKKSVKHYNKCRGAKIGLAMVLSWLFFLPPDVFATQLHAASEGIITHQVGHLFFLFSMVALIFTITGKALDTQKGWRLIQYSAIFFILWNLDAIAAHFFDNQIQVVKIENISLGQIRVVARNGSPVLAWIYYGLKLDHLLCVPALLFFYRGLSCLVSAQQQVTVKKETP